MTELLAELEACISLLEAEIPANVEAPENLPLSDSLEKILAKYFKKLEAGFPYSKLAAIYNQNVITESVGSDTRKALDPLLASLASALQGEIEGQLVTTYLKGSAEMITWGKTKGGIPIAYEGPPIKQAMSYAKKHGAQLVKGMDATTKDRLANLISDGITKKRGIPNLTRDIKKSFGDMKTYRAKMIARTETNDALSQAFMDRSHDMGIKGKEWITNDPCEICEANEAEGVVSIDHVFSGGVDRPPQHPNCNCALAPARLPK